MLQISQYEQALNDVFEAVNLIGPHPSGSFADGVDKALSVIEQIREQVRQPVFNLKRRHHAKVKSSDHSR